MPPEYSALAQHISRIREFGWTNPVLVDGKNVIIAGHAAGCSQRKQGMSTVPVIELSGLSEAQKPAYIIADLLARLPASPLL